MSDQEFGFVESMPKRALSRTQRVLRDAVIAERRMEAGSPHWPLTVAALFLGVSRQRAHQLVRAGRIDAIKLLGQVMVSVKSVRDLKANPRPSGRQVGWRKHKTA